MNMQHQAIAYLLFVSLNAVESTAKVSITKVTQDERSADSCRATDTAYITDRM